MRAVIFVAEPRVWRRDGTPGGLALLERQLKQLRAIGVEAPVLLVPHDAPEPVLPAGLAVAGVVRVAAGETCALGALVEAAAVLPSDFVFLSADRLVDARALRALATRVDSVFVEGEAGAVEPVAHLTAGDVRRFGTALPTHAARLPLRTLDPYVAELRGEVAPYVLAVRSAGDRPLAWRTLLDHVQKQSLDLPGRYFDTPFENALVRWLAPTRITPNQVTALTIALAALTGFLFLHGWLRVGVLLALVVGILDGVDGKLARLKLATSKLGELEHIADFFYENFWYLALATYLETVTGSPRVWHVGLALVALDLSDGLLYTAVRARTGKMLDELSSFDRAFRGIAGRRNVYVMVFAVGFFAGHAAGAFEVAALWAAATVLIHAVRSLAWIRPRRFAPGTVGAQISETEPRTVLLVSEK